MTTIHDKLVAIQSSLKAPKGQTNTFGKYKYRSCEDILEALKPLLKEQGCTLTLSDEIVLVGTRFYVKATALLTSKERVGENISVAVNAYAREEEVKKGMDSSQITGAASSYARKYALNGLFCIDDTKDADTMDNTKAEPKVVKTVEKKARPTVQRVMETLTPCQTPSQVETVWDAAMKHQWSEHETNDLNECKANVLSKILPI